MERRLAWAAKSVTLAQQKVWRLRVTAGVPPLPLERQALPAQCRQQNRRHGAHRFQTECALRRKTTALLLAPERTARWYRSQHPPPSHRTGAGSSARQPPSDWLTPENS